MVSIGDPALGEEDEDVDVAGGSMEDLSRAEPERRGSIERNWNRARRMLVDEAAGTLTRDQVMSPGFSERQRH